MRASLTVLSSERDSRLHRRTLSRDSNHSLDAKTTLSVIGYLILQSFWAIFNINKSLYEIFLSLVGPKTVILSMSTIINGGMTLTEYLSQKSKAKGQISVVVECNDKIEADGFARLRRTIENVNRNIKSCGVEVMDNEGVYKSLMSAEELEAIKLELPAGLTEIQKLKAIEAFAAEKKKEMGGMAYDLCDKTLDYNLR